MGTEERTDCDSMSRLEVRPIGLKAANRFVEVNHRHHKKYVGGGAAVSEENIKKFYETIARIISEREQIKVTVKVSRKQEAAEPCLN